MKLLSICIPTYKRSKTLRECIDSVVSQIEDYALSDSVDIYVANDASPDDTVDVLEQFDTLKYFSSITRKNNIGMSANIKSMLEEALQVSTFQLIITDDDFLQPSTLESIVKFLAVQYAEKPDISLIWTPRYSYTEDGNLHGIVCKTFQSDTLVLPSIRNAGRYMYNGFVLSGLIVKSRDIDFSFWNEYLENAYFPMIFSGDLILRNCSVYWDKNIVHHCVLNECHWDRWGQSDAEITLRLFIDYINSYVVIGRSLKIKSMYQTLLFYTAAFPRVLQMTYSLLITAGGFFRLSNSDSVALLTNDKVSFSKIARPAKVIFYIMMTRILFVSLFRTFIRKILSIIMPKHSKRERWQKSYLRQKQCLVNAIFIIRWAW